MIVLTAPQGRNRKKGLPGPSTAIKVRSSSIATLTELPAEMASSRRTTLGNIEMPLSTPNIVARLHLALQLSTGLEQCITFRTFALIVFAHPTAHANSCTCRSCATSSIERAHGGRFVGKYSTFCQSDNFSWILRFKEVGNPHFLGAHRLL